MTGKALLKTSAIVVLVAIISALHFGTPESLEHRHSLLREAYYLPLALGAVWFGLKGALTTTLSIALLYLPFTISRWDALSHVDLERLLATALLGAVGVAIGVLSDRVRRQEQERRTQIVALAGAVAHEVNTPLFSALAAAQLLKEDLPPQSPLREDAYGIERNLHCIRDLVWTLTRIEDVILREYASGDKIVDIEASCRKQPIHSGRAGHDTRS